MAASERVIIIPAYNEEATIETVVSKILPYATVLVVNDCSKDQTPQRALAAGAQVVTQETNKGYEEALNRGFQRASELGFKYALTFDADGQHDASVIESFFQPLEENKFDLVVGVRPEFARLSEKVIAKYFQLRFGIQDPLCGMKAYRLDLYNEIGFFDKNKLIGSELLLRCLLKNARTLQIPIPIHARLDKPRFGNIWRANIKIFKALLRSVRISS